MNVLLLGADGFPRSPFADCIGDGRTYGPPRRASAGAPSGRDRRGLCAGCRSGRLAGTAHRGRCGDQHRRDPAGGSRAAFRCHPRPGAGRSSPPAARRACAASSLGARSGCRCRESIPPEQLATLNLEWVIVQPAFVYGLDVEPPRRRARRRPRRPYRALGRFA